MTVTMVAAYPGKRAVDLAGATSACVVFAPIVAAIALAIWLDDRGSPFFTQTRVGTTRRVFRIFKLRTMRAGEVTRVGRWLRRTGLDELPQFANVWRGEMSVVGPRPLTADDLVRLDWSSASHDRAHRSSTSPRASQEHRVHRMPLPTKRGAGTDPR